MVLKTIFTLCLFGIEMDGKDKINLAHPRQLPLFEELDDGSLKQYVHS
jgi:hypothetical protein